MCLSSWKYIKIGIFFSVSKGRYGLQFSICCSPVEMTASINSTGERDRRWDTERYGGNYWIYDHPVHFCWPLQASVNALCEEQKKKRLWLDSSTLATIWELTIINPCPNILHFLLLMSNISSYHMSVSIEVHWLKSKCKYRFWCIHFNRRIKLFAMSPQK